MKTKLKNALIIAFVLIVVLSGFSYYFVGYVPIVGKMIANNKLSRYEGSSVNASFSFPYGDSYSAVLNNRTNVNYDLKLNIIADSQVTGVMEEEANVRFNEIESTLPENLRFPEVVNVRTWIDADDYTQLFHRIDILNVYNDEPLDEDVSLRMPSQIAQDVIKAMGLEYNFQSVHVIYADSNGMYECIVKFKRGINLDEALLVESTTKLPDSELPEDYLEWLKKQG